MDRKGFTLVELIAVLVLIAIVSMLTIPALGNLRKNNNEKEFTTYMDMMVSYTKTIPNYRKKSCLYLNNLGLKPINESMSCDGYVTISENSITPFLYCKDVNGNDLYKTNGYLKPNNC